MRKGKYILWLIVGIMASCATTKLPAVLKPNERVTSDGMKELYIPIIQTLHVRDTIKVVKRIHEQSEYGPDFKRQIQSFMDDSRKSSSLNIEWQNKYLDLLQNKGRERIEEIDSLKYLYKTLVDSISNTSSDNRHFYKEWKASSAAQNTLLENTKLSNKIIIVGFIILFFIGLYNAYLSKKLKNKNV